ncbi:MAG: hypothetical protein R3209_13760 [Salinimicrobium sediminis]|nr:hypothetical protein [Salinimicrobium sediminis]
MVKTIDPNVHKPQNVLQIMAAAKKPTKQDLEAKIAELEAKLSQLSTQLESKPAEAKPAETKPAETKPAPKPEERPAATTKPKGTLPKGFDKPAEAPKPQDAPKPAETNAQPPATVQEALENAYYNAPETSFHEYRAKVTGYSPAPNRYFVRRTAPVGTVPTTNWNEQKAKVTGYTQPSNQYFATRARLAYHPPDKTFGGFSGTTLSVQGVEAKAQTQQAPPPQQTSSNSGKSRQEELEEYEKEYLQRLENEKIAQEKELDRIIEEESKRRSSATRGSLPKGFEPKPEPEAPKPSRGTLPKGF